MSCTFWVLLHKLICFSVFLLYVASKRGLPRKFSRFVLFRPIKKRSFSFNLLCVLDDVPAILLTLALEAKHSKRLMKMPRFMP